MARAELRLLPQPLVCEGLELRRFHAEGMVWVLAQDVDRLPAVSTWWLRQRDPALSGRRIRLAGGNMHPRLAFTLPTLQQMALLARGPAAMVLFELVSAEIEAGRHLFVEDAHGA